MVFGAAVPAARAQSSLYAFTNFAGLPGGYGNVDGIGTAARFNVAAGIAVDKQRNIYVADSFNHSVRKITQDGVVTTFAGRMAESGEDDGVGSTARFDRPTSLTCDSNGNLYLTDAGNNLVRKISPIGAVTTLAGRSHQAPEFAFSIHPAPSGIGLLPELGLGIWAWFGLGKFGLGVAKASHLGLVSPKQVIAALNVGTFDIVNDLP